MLTKEITQVDAVVSMGSAFQRCDNSPNVAHMAAARTNRISPRQAPARVGRTERLSRKKATIPMATSASPNHFVADNLSPDTTKERTAAKMGMSPGVMTA